MAIKIQMNMKNSSGTYDVLYPQTLGSQVSGAVASATSATSATSAGKCTGNSATATKLATSRTIQTSLGSTSSASFDGSANITPGVTGTLALGNGGTGGTTASTGLYNLIKGCSTRSASLVNSYASTTYLGAYYSSTGYRIAISNLLTYFQNNISSNAGLVYVKGSRNGNGSTSFSISMGKSITPLILNYSQYSSPLPFSYWKTTNTSSLKPKYTDEIFLTWSGASTTSGFSSYASESNGAIVGVDVSYSGSTLSFSRINSSSAEQIGNVSGTTYYYFIIGY